MIVMKFGGTSVGDAERIAGAATIVAHRAARGPVVVVSALAGVTDLLARAVDLARDGSREALEPVLSDLARRHRWAVSGSVSDPGRRHDLDLEVDAILEDLRQLLRSVRVLGEGTPRAADAVLATGELLSSKVFTAALVDRGCPAVWVDAREVVRTDGRHQSAEPDLAAVAERAGQRLAPHVASGTVPVVGGFYGSGPDGRTTTLGRGGSDLTAAVLGCGLGAEEIEIWTDVDGIMTADPRRVPAARLRESVSFAEAAELAFYGAKVLHPASIAPAVRRAIPVRVLNALAPEGGGTRIVREPARGAPPLASVACRAAVTALRVSSRTLRAEPGFLPAVVSCVAARGAAAELAAACETGVTIALATDALPEGLLDDLERHGRLERTDGRAVVCVVGQGLAHDASVRARVLAALARHEPEVVVLGGAAASAAALVPEARLDDAVRALHGTFFEEGSV